MRSVWRLAGAATLGLFGWLLAVEASAAPACSDCDEALAVVYRSEGAGLPVAELWRGWGGEWERAGRLARVPLLMDGQLWEVTTQLVPVPWYDCACDRERAAAELGDAEQFCTRKFRTPWPVAVGPLPWQRVQLAKTPADCGSEGGPWPPDFTFRAVLGDLVVVQGSGSSNGCGAHTDQWASFGAVQVSEGRAVPLWDEMEAVAVARACEAASLDQLFPPGNDWLPQARLEAQGEMPKLNAMQAVWKEGRFRPRWLISRYACFACGDSEWESYSQSAWVDLEAPLSYALQRFALLPAAFRTLSAQVPDAIGFALLPAMSLPEELLRLAPPSKRRLPRRDR